MFLVYGTETKGYRLYDCERQQVTFSGDVKFIKSDFGIKKEPSNGTDKLITIELSSDNDVAEDTETTACQSSRERGPPNHLGQWITVASEGVAEPTTVHEALSSPDVDQWHEARQREMDSLHKQDVWKLIELPEGRKTIGSKWILK